MRVLWIPNYSMRSYETGKYALQKDGNLQLTFARILASDFEDITIVFPRGSSDLPETYSNFAGTHLEVGLPHTRIGFQQLHFGANALETRRLFWQLNADFMAGAEKTFDLLITDITGYAGSLPVIFNFNITKLPELQRPYIDEFFETDLKSIERSFFTTVLNPRQREYILEVRPDLKNRVAVNTRCAHKALLPHFTVGLASKYSIFFPFRLSDKAYKFEELLAAFEEQNLDEHYSIIVTDPNDTLKNQPRYVHRIKPSKAEYYRILAARPTVIMLDDIDTVLHPGTIEFFHYQCPVITFPSKLLPHENQISDLAELSSCLENIRYNRVDLTNFVYQVGDIDDLYRSRPIISG